MILLSSSCLVTTVTQAEKEIWARREPKSIKFNDDKWLANLSKVMTFIADKGR